MKEIIIICFWCFYSLLSAHSQGSFWSDQNLKENNRWEGLTEINVGNSPLVLIALHSWRLKEYNKGDNLNIAFFLPDDKQVAINARNLSQENKKYKMVVKNERRKAGWQKFTPWHVDDVLVPKGIRANELAVLITDDNETYYPAAIRRNDTILSLIKQYTGYFYTPDFIDSVQIRVLDKNTDIISKKRSGQKEARSTFSLQIIVPNNAPDGKYTLDIDFYYDGIPNNKQYVFYHKHKM
jgi:hypothetical protein